MPTEAFSTAHLDYLQRVGLVPEGLSAVPEGTYAPPELRRLQRIKGIGRIQKQWIPGQQQNPERLPSEDVLIGMYGAKIPVAFLLHGKPGGIEIHIGAWSSVRENAAPSNLDYRQEILKDALRSLYASVDFADASPELKLFPFSGLGLGIPTAKPADAQDGAWPIDRLTRALSGVEWAFLILAEPVDERVISNVRHSLVNEMRRVQTAAQSDHTPSPLAEQYVEMLKLSTQAMTAALATGAWRTGVYLLGDAKSYYRLTSVWRGIFSGDKSLPEPIRIHDSAAASTLATKWALPDTPSAQGPGLFHHLLQFQTLLTSQQLAAYVHLPRSEMAGFAVNGIPDFDAVPSSSIAPPSLSLGRVIHRSQPTETDYRVSFPSLTRHTFIAGVTGAGKTNTIFHILKEAAANRVPFWIIEPAKTEYRSLLNDAALGGVLQVFTLGNENASPFRLNPFEALPGTPVSVHLDLLRSVFSASFGMWTPLPQVLEQCLHRIYEDRGWDIRTNTNHRMADSNPTSLAYPTLTDLMAMVEEVTRGLGYDEKLTSDIRAALSTRINSLRTGGKGAMLDVQYSMSMEGLLNRPTILELEHMGDDDEKAFMMGLLFIRLVEFRRTEKKVRGLKHLLVIEEAHRLLANVAARSGEEEANPRGKAVEAFSNLLSEIRAYGQGVIVADQVPTKLAPDVIKNTTLKIAHRVVDREDREALAGAMAMTDSQTHSLATLRVGQAAVFTEGDDAPLLVSVNLSEAKANDQNEISDNDIARLAQSSRKRPEEGAMFRPFPICAQTCKTTGPACQCAGLIVQDAAFQRIFSRIILSAMENTDAVDRLWGELLAIVRARRPRLIDETILMRCVLIRGSEWLTSHRGAQSGWTYTRTGEMAGSLRRLLLNKLDGIQTEADRVQFRQVARTLHARDYLPFSACNRICDQDPPVCLYRYAVLDMIDSTKYNVPWSTARNNDTDNAKSQGGRHDEMIKVCLDAAENLVEWPEPEWSPVMYQTSKAVVRRVCLCFAQQMLNKDSGTPLRVTDITVQQLVKETDNG